MVGNGEDFDNFEKTLHTGVFTLQVLTGTGTTKRRGSTKQRFLGNRYLFEVMKFSTKTF